MSSLDPRTPGASASPTVAAAALAQGVAARGLLEADFLDARSKHLGAALFCVGFDRWPGEETSRPELAALEPAGVLASDLDGVVARLDPLGTAAVAREGAHLWVAAFALSPGEALERARGAAALRRGASLTTPDKRLRASVSIGVAHGDHRSQPSLEVCLAVAEEGLHVARMAGGGRAVHSEVYGAFAKRPIGERPQLELVRAGRVPEAPVREVAQASAAGHPARAASPAGVNHASAAGANGPSASRHGTPPSPRAEHEDLVRWLREHIAGLERAPASDGGVEDVDLLRRRMGKLLSALERAEDEIARLRGELPGLASTYREVQGLREDDALADVKRGVIARLFADNVAAQEPPRDGPQPGAGQ